MNKYLPYLKKYTPHSIILIIGFAIGYLVCVRNSNDKIQKRFQEAYRIESVMNERIKGIDALNNGLRQRNETLYDRIYADSVESALERTKTIPIQKTLKQEANILIVGQELYGSSPATNSKRALVASYGNQALNEVEILRRVNSNQKALIINCEKVVQIKDTIIVEYKEGLKYAAKKSKKGQFSKGLGLGVLGSILVGLLVL